MPEPFLTPFPFLDNLDPSASWSSMPADRWLRVQHTWLLRRMLTWVGRFLVLSAVMVFIMGLTAPRFWQVWAILGMLLIGLGMDRLAAKALRRGQIERSSLLLILLQIHITIVCAVLFDDMLIDFAVLGLLHILMTNILVSPRASVGIAVGLVIVGAAILVMQLGGVLIAPLVIPWVYATIIHVFIFVMTIFLGTLLVGQNTNNARQALWLSVEQARKLEQANARLAEEMASRQQAEADRLKLAVEHERVRILSEFIRNASHEFRHPLAIINTDLFLLKKKHPEVSDSPHVARIHGQAAYILSLVEALLEMSRLDGGVDFAHTPVYLPELLRDLTTTFTSQLAERDAQIVLRLEDDLPRVMGDGDQLHRALEHILRNAAEYTRPGGVVDVAVRRAGDGLVIDVRDDGPGILPDDLPHIFERFYRGDKARTSRGVGLGLPIAHKIIERHGGQVEVVSAPEQGSTFKVTLPLSGHAAQPMGASPGAPPSAARSPR
jgi:signal transduction histidine kinase